MKIKNSSKVIVFDFDKTLTYKDTNLDFLISSQKNYLLLFFRLTIYMFFVLTRKLKLISNSELKNFGLFLFFSGVSEDDIKRISIEYSKKIKLNNKILNKLKEHKTLNHNVIIITASYLYYVKPIFQNIKVFGTSIKKFKSAYKIDLHCYRHTKLKILREAGINVIDEIYTDSLSDMPLVRISRKINLVKNGIIIACNSKNDFITNLRKN